MEETNEVRGLGPIFSGAIHTIPAKMQRNPWHVLKVQKETPRTKGPITRRHFLDQSGRTLPKGDVRQICRLSRHISQTEGRPTKE